MQVKVWFQNRRTKYKRAKADDEQDEPSALSPVSGRHQGQTTHEDDDDSDDENDAKKSAMTSGVEDALDCNGAASPSYEQLPQTQSPPSAICRNNGDDRLPTGGCHDDDNFRSPLLSSSRQTVSGCQNGGKKHSSNSVSPASRRNKTSHHVNRWRAETNQL